MALKNLEQDPQEEVLDLPQGDLKGKENSPCTSESKSSCGKRKKQLKSQERRRSSRLVTISSPERGTSFGASSDPAVAIPGNATSGGKEQELCPVTPRINEGSKVHEKKKKKTKKVGKELPRQFSQVTWESVKFKVGDDVYVKRQEDCDEESDEELEQCQLCAESGGCTMIECDDCLGGFHLGCLEPPLEAVPEGDWKCPRCRGDDLPSKAADVVSRGMKRRRTARERLMALELWAVRIESLWRDHNGTYWFRGRWYEMPEETCSGRLDHHGKRELFRSTQCDDIEMASILRHCWVASLEKFREWSNEGDDIYFCEYEYDPVWRSFRRITDEASADSGSEEEWMADDKEESSDDESMDEADSDGASSSSEEEEEWEGARSKKRARRALVVQSTGKGKGGRRGTITATPKAANRWRKGAISCVGVAAIPASARRRPKTEMEKAKAALMLSAIPKSMPCRERERSQVTAFIEEAVSAGEHCLGRCLYVSGVPGTGKTATVLEIMREMRRRVDAGDLPAFQFVEINGLRLPSPQHAYSVLQEALTGQRMSPRVALEHLEARFSGASKAPSSTSSRPCILLVDELDLLVTRNQTVLYNLFDWPTRPNSRLVVVGIANTIDLPERLLPRIVSRMGLTRVGFNPYTREQLQEIVSTRLCGIDAFEPQAVELASRKVAAVSGDVRRALELCRRAVELTEARVQLSKIACQAGSTQAGDLPSTSTGGSQKISMSDIDAAIQEMFSCPHMQMLKRCSRHEKIFLVAVMMQIRKNGMAETTFEKVAETHLTIAHTNARKNEEIPDLDTLLALSCRLGSCRLLLCERGGRHRLQKLQLNIPSDDVSFVLQQDSDLPWLARYLTA